MTMISYIAALAICSGPATAAADGPEDRSTISVIRQISRPTEVRPSTDKLVVQSQLAILDHLFARRTDGLTVLTDGYAGRPPLNRATILAIRREFDPRAFPIGTARLTERQRMILLTNGAVHVARALELIREVHPLADRVPRLRAAATTAFVRFKDRLGIEREGNAAPVSARDLRDRVGSVANGPVAVVHGSDLNVTLDGDERFVPVDLPHARIFADFELARTRPPTRSKTAACAYQLHTVTDQADSIGRLRPSSTTRY